MFFNCSTSRVNGQDDLIQVDCYRVEPGELLSSMERERLVVLDLPGQMIQEDLDAVVENILATGRFDTVAWRQETASCGNQVIFDLVPQPYVGSLSFYGNDQMNDNKLERASKLRKFRPFSQEILEDSLVELRDYYLINGFPLPSFKTVVDGPEKDGAMKVTISVTEMDLPHAESIEYRITGHPGPWWNTRLKMVFGWFNWKARRKGFNLVALQKLTRHEERALRETGYRNAKITIHRESGSKQYSPRVLVEIMVGKPVKVDFDNVGYLKSRDIVHNWKRKRVSMSEKELNRLVDRTYDRLQKDGWLDVEVASNLQDKPRSIVAEIDAQKGLRRYIGEVELMGKSPLEEDDLGSIAGLHTPRLMGLWKTRPGPRAIEDAEKALITHLENLGYTRPSCSVEIDPETLAKEAVKVNVEARAGAQRLIGSIAFEGNTGLDEVLLLEQSGLIEGGPFVRREIKEAITAMTRLYWKNGYSDVSMQAKTRRKGGEMDVVFVINEGPAYKQGPLILNGNVKTRSSLIYRLKRIAAGGPFDLEQLGELQEAMYRTGVFESVSIRTEKHASADSPYQTVVLDIVERSTGSFETGIDFNTDRGIEGVLEIGDRNLLGQALHGKISGIFGQERWLVSGSLGRPLFFGYPLENRLRAAVSDDRTNSGYNLRTYEVELSTIRRWDDDDVSLTLTYAYEREDVRDLDPDVADEIDIEDTRTGSLTPVLTLDKRDDPFRTTRGWFYQTRFKGSFDQLGSEEEFLRWDHDFRLFWPLDEDGDYVLGGAVRMGRGWVMGDSVMPAGERYFLGGAGTNRGFEHKECGPMTEDGDPLGGLSYLLANLELRMHISGRFHGAVFVDAGNVFADTPDSPYLRPSAGLGVRYETPIGPFRVDMGFNLDPDPGEPDYVLQIAFGHAF